MQQDDFYVLTTAAANEPIRLLEARNFTKKEDDSEDIFLRSLIKTARSSAEFFTGRSFVQRTFTGKFGGLVQTSLEARSFVQLNRSPLISVTSVKVLNDGSLVDVDSADYFLKESDQYSRVLFITPPTVDDDVPYPLEIEFVVGYDPIPEDILSAMKAHIMFLFENRGDVVPEGENFVPLISRATYMDYKILDTFG